MKRILLSTICCLFVMAASAQRISLAGIWNFEIDRNDQGIVGRWFDRRLSDQVSLPGSMLINNKGDEVDVNTKWTGDIVDRSYYDSDQYAKYRREGNIKYPFWLQPVKYYVGRAWYQREVDIPRDWKEKSISLFMERCHWESRVWIDGNEIGTSTALSAPQHYDLTGVITPGRHIITISVDNRIKKINPGINSHSISDHTQGNWNGMIGDLYIEAKPSVHWGVVSIFPDFHHDSLTVKANVRNDEDRRQTVAFEFNIGTMATKGIKRTVNTGDTPLEFTIPLPKDIKQWDEFNPNLYSVSMSVTNKGTVDSKNITFGCRDLSVRDSVLCINGHPAFMRGTLHCAAFPLTGYPSTDKNEWLREFRIMKDHGLNHVRFHTWCPPEAAFQAADELGMYLAIECSSWANDGRYEAKDTALSANLGHGRAIDQFIYQESRDIVNAYGNHPSFCFMSYGNEPGGNHFTEFLTKFVSYWKSTDDRRLYTSAAGWPNLEVSDFNNDPAPRIQAWGEGLNSIINSKSPSTAYDWRTYTSKFKNPFISHEIGQWCVYPDFKEMKEYTGIYKPRNFEIFRETLQENGLSLLADSFLLASGKLQTLCYKADIEAALRTKNFGGFQLLGLNDFPGQGTALVGALNVFWGEKGYVSPRQYRRFCNYLVPLARMDQLIYQNTDTLRAAVEVANYYKTIDKPVVAWHITDASNTEIAKGTFDIDGIKLGNGIKLGDIAMPLRSITNPSQMKLEVSVNGFVNDWDFWVYPTVHPAVAKHQEIMLTDRLDKKSINYLLKGGKVILSIRKGSLKDEYGGNIAVGFSSIFWNTLWTNGQPPFTLGILCDPKHPALSAFPTDYHSNYQWWDAMSHSNAINIGVLSPHIKPIVRVIDDWFTNRSLALLFEVKAGKGKLIISGVDFFTDMDKRLSARQLLYSIKQYMCTPSFNPSVEITAEDINKMIK